MTSVGNQKALFSLHVGQSAVIALGVGTIMLLAGQAVKNGAMTVGDLVLINAYVLQVCLPLNALGFVYREARDAWVNAERLLVLLNEKPEIEEAPDLPPLAAPVKGEVVFEHVSFGYEHAHHMKSAHDVYEQGAGVCRDFAHLALTFCRCMNIPARYCTGYLGDIGIPRDPAPMDFSGWFQVYLSGQWYTFDARHNVPRAGRILMGTGRDAADVALTTSFGRMDLVKFFVISDEVVPA